MKLNGIKIYIALFIGLTLYNSCSSYKFQRTGTYINGFSALYYNDSLRLCLDMPGDFEKYNPKYHTGIRLDSFYANDKRVLRKLHISKTKTSILYSVIPIVSPYYNFIAVLRDSSDINLKHYQHKIYLDTLQFYYKIQETKKIELEETLIPYKSYYIEFIHYNNKINECPFCDIEEITIKNRYRILKGHAFDYKNYLSQCETTTNPALISIPQEKVLQNNRGLLIAYKVDTILKTREFETFQILKPGQNQTELNICPGNYLIRYTDLNHHLFWSVNKKVD
jgi:hypothetical protein